MSGLKILNQRPLFANRVTPTNEVKYRGVLKLIFIEF